METIRSKRTSASRSRSVSLKKFDTGACPLPTKAELDYAKEIFQGFPKEAKTILSKLSSSPTSVSKGKKLMIGGARWYHHILTSIICLGLAGVSFKAIISLIGATTYDTLMIHLSTYLPCGSTSSGIIDTTLTWGSSLVSGFLGTTSPITCSQRETNFKLLVGSFFTALLSGKVRDYVVIVASYPSKVYNSVLNVVEVMIPDTCPSTERERIEHEHSVERENERLRMELEELLSHHRSSSRLSRSRRSRRSAYSDDSEASGGRRIR